MTSPSTSPTTEMPSSTSGTTGPAPRSWAALAVLLGGLFMALLDTTVVNVALPSIRTSLHADEATLSWVISGYALSFGLALIPAGRMGDRFGHKWVFFVGVALFTVASLTCGLAQTDTALVVSRVVQGLAGGVFVPAVTATIQLLFPPHSRGRAFAIMGSVIGVSTALGPIVGGLIIQDFGDLNGWRGVFWVNIPFGIAVLIAAAVVVPARSAGQQRPRSGIDWVGLALLSAGLVALLVPLIEGQNQGWPTWSYLSIASAVVLLVGFWVWESAGRVRGGAVLVPPRLFRHAAFTGGVVLSLVFFAAFTGIFFTISLLWQSGLGHTALESGIVSVPFALGNILGSSLSNRLSRLLGRTVLVVGTGLVTLGLAWVWLAFAFTPWQELTNWELLPALFMAGLGAGCFIAPTAQFIVATVPSTDAGAGSAVIQVMQRIGSAIGVAVIGSVLFGTLPDRIVTHAQFASGFTHSAAAAMLVSACLAAAAFLLVFTLPPRISGTGNVPEAGA